MRVGPSRAAIGMLLVMVANTIAMARSREEEPTFRGTSDISKLRFARVKRSLASDEQEFNQSAVVVSSTIPAAQPSFEAAFQGKCGDQSGQRRGRTGRRSSSGNPCEHLCLDLHDGTYECACLAGFTLAVDGYSCTRPVFSEQWPSTGQNRNKTTPASGIRRRSSNNQQVASGMSPTSLPEARGLPDGLFFSSVAPPSSSSSSPSPPQRQEGQFHLLDLQNDNKQRESAPIGSGGRRRDEQRDKRRRKLASTNLMDDARGPAQVDIGAISSEKEDDDANDDDHHQPALPVSRSNTSKIEVDPTAEAGQLHDQSFDYQVEPSKHRAKEDRPEPEQDEEEEEQYEDVRSIKVANDRLLVELAGRLNETATRTTGGDSYNGNNAGLQRPVELPPPSIDGGGWRREEHSDDIDVVETGRAGGVAGGHQPSASSGGGGGHSSIAEQISGLSGGGVDGHLPPIDDGIGGGGRDESLDEQEEEEDDHQDGEDGKQRTFDYDLSLLEALINKTIKREEPPEGRADYSGAEINEAASGGGSAIGENRSSRRQWQQQRPPSTSGRSSTGSRWMEASGGRDDMREDENNEGEAADDGQQPPVVAVFQRKPSSERVGQASSKKLAVTSSSSSSSSSPATRLASGAKMTPTQDKQTSRVAGARSTSDNENNSKQPQTNNTSHHHHHHHHHHHSKDHPTSCLAMAECESGGECIEEPVSSRAQHTRRRRARCRCPIGRGGDLCQRPIQRNVPKFSGVSYLALPMTNDHQLAYLKLDFKPSELRHQQQQQQLQRPPTEATSSVLLSTDRFTLVMDSTNRVELRYWQMTNHIRNERQLTRVMGSRDVRLDQWNELVITDASSDKTLEITEGNDDQSDQDEDEDGAVDDNEPENKRQYLYKKTSPNKNKIVLVMPDKIHLDELDDGQRQAKQRARRRHQKNQDDDDEEDDENDDDANDNDNPKGDVNSQLFVGGLPEPVLVNYRPRESDNHHDNSIGKGSSNTSDDDSMTRRLILDEKSNLFGFTGCIRSIQVNGRVYNMRSDLNGDALDGFDLGECDQ